MTHVNILFINPHAYFSNHQYEMELPTHILYIASFLKSRLSNDISIAILDLMMERKHYRNEKKDFDDLDNLKGLIKTRIDASFNPRHDSAFFIAMSCYSSFHYTKTIHVLSAIRALSNESAIPHPVVVIGGYHATAIPGDFRNLGVDFVIRGEGELAMLEILKHATFKDDTPTVLDGQIIHDLDDLPPVDFRLYEPYLHEYHHLGIALSRGCPQSCNFCMEEELSHFKPKKQRWRVYSIGRAKEELKHAIQTSEDVLQPDDDNKVLGLYDPTFGYNPSWRDDILKFLIHERKGYKTWCETRVDTIKADQLAMFKEADVHFMLGLETGSPKILTLMNKTNQPVEYLDNLKRVALHARTIDYAPIVCNLIFNFPGETRDTIDETFTFLHSLLEEKVQVTAMGQYYFLCPGDQVFRHVEKWEREHGTKFHCKDWWYEDERMMKGSIIDASKTLNYVDASRIYNDRLKAFYQECMDIWDTPRCKIDFLKKIQREDRMLELQVKMFESLALKR